MTGEWAAAARRRHAAVGHRRVPPAADRAGHVLSSARCSPRSRCRCRCTRSPAPRSTWAWSASPGWCRSWCFGLYGGAIADAMDRRLLYLASSLGDMGDDARPAAADRRRHCARVADPAARRRSVRRVRGLVLGARRDHPAHRRPRAGAGREHAQLHRRNAGARSVGPLFAGAVVGASPRLRLCLRHRCAAVHRRPVLDTATAADPAGRDSAGARSAPEPCSTDCGSSRAARCW